MGLFDRFKKRFKRTEEEVTAEGDSVEAEEALDEGLRLKEALEQSRRAPEAPPPQPPEVEDEWDDSEAEDPFAKPVERKERKKARRAASVKKAENPPEIKETVRRNPMESTTGRTLVATGPAEIEVDFGDSSTKTGGRVVKASGKLDQLLEELEEELLTSDMAQSAAEEVIQTLKATLIGSRISTTKNCLLYTSPSPRDS